MKIKLKWQEPTLVDIYGFKEVLSKIVEETKLKYATNWIKEPTETGWWWMLIMEYAQSVSCRPVNILMAKGKSYFYNKKKHQWVPIEKEFSNNSEFTVLGWQRNLELYFNPDDY